MLNQPPMQAPTEPAKSLPMYPYADSSHPKYGEFLSTARDILTEGKPIITRHKVLHDAWMAKGRKVPALLPTKELAAKAEAHKMFASDMDWICFQSEEGEYPYGNVQSKVPGR